MGETSGGGTDERASKATGSPVAPTTKEERERAAAKDHLDRAEREIRRLTELGMDVTALSDRFASAQARFAEGKYSDVESLCGEVLVLAKSMSAIAAATMKASGRVAGGEKLSEAMRMEIMRLISTEVANRVEAVARTLPTSATIAETVQTKIQEALVTGGLMARLEAIAAEKAQAAVAAVPHFTAKDAQAAANLVVQRALTQFLTSKELQTRIKAVVETELVQAMEAAERRLLQASEALVNSRVASVMGSLPTYEKLEERIQAALGLFLKSGPFEERVLSLAAERARAEVERAPDLMSEAAGRIARQEADLLLKAHVHSQEFLELVRQTARDVTAEVLAAQPKLTSEDVEVIARRIVEESAAGLADSEPIRTKAAAIAQEAIQKAFGAEGFDAKVKALARAEADSLPRVKPEDLSKALDAKAGELDSRLKALEAKLASGLDEKLAEVAKKLDELTKAAATKEDLAEGIAASRRELMTSPDFAGWIKDGVMAILREIGLGEGIHALEKSLASEDKIEKIARHEALTAAMDVLETKEFTRRIITLLDDKAVRAKLEQIAGSAVSPEQVEQIAELQAKNAIVAAMESEEFSEKVKALADTAGSKDLAKKLMERMEKIEKEALPALVDTLVSEKLGGLSETSIGAKVEAEVQKGLAGKLDPEAIKQQIVQVAAGSIREIANSPEFKAMLDEKFKVMMNYLTQEVIPKQIRRMMGGA